MSIFLMNLKRNLKGAFTTVKANFREYICFFLALILVQMLFCTTVITVNNGRLKRALLRSGDTTIIAFSRACILPM